MVDYHWSNVWFLPSTDCRTWPCEKTKQNILLNARNSIQSCAKDCAMHQQHSWGWEKVLEIMVMEEFYVLIDEIGIQGWGTFEEHIEIVCSILDRIQKAVLTISAKKMKIACDQVVYLGSLVDKHGIQLDPAKIECLKNLIAPQDVKSLRQFLGFTGYYRRHIRDFAEKISCLRDLLKKKE